MTLFCHWKDSELPLVKGMTLARLRLALILQVGKASTSGVGERAEESALSAHTAEKRLTTSFLPLSSEVIPLGFHSFSFLSPYFHYFHYKTALKPYFKTKILPSFPHPNLVFFIIFALIHPHF